MTECLHHTKLCDATKAERTNNHRCFLDPDHTGPHVCICWHRWPNKEILTS